MKTFDGYLTINFQLISPGDTSPRWLYSPDRDRGLVFFKYGILILAITCSSGCRKASVGVPEFEIGSDIAFKTPRLSLNGARGFALRIRNDQDYVVELDVLGTGNVTIENPTNYVTIQPERSVTVRGMLTRGDRGKIRLRTNTRGAEDITIQLLR